MARSGLVTPTKDEGEIHFHGDVKRGMVTVTIRAPLSIDKRTVEMSISDLMEITANITLETLAFGKQMRAQLEKQTPA